jgi:uncharacterized cupredoxin-like copper-binding protein
MALLSVSVSHPRPVSFPPVPPADERLYPRRQRGHRVWRGAMAVAALLAATPAGAATDWQRAQQLTVIASEYEFSPPQLVLQRGVPYRLRVENHGKELHEFHAPELFSTSELRDTAALNADRSEIQVAPGKQKTLYLVPRQAGHFALICPDHDWAGMTGDIVVK